MSEENTLPPGIEMKSEATYPGVLSKVGHTIADTVVTGVAGGVVGAGVGLAGGMIASSLTSGLLPANSVNIVSQDLQKEVPNIIAGLKNDGDAAVRSIATQLNAEQIQAAIPNLVKGASEIVQAARSAMPVIGAAAGATVGATGGAMAGFGTGAVSSFTATTEKPVVGKWTQEVLAQPSGVRER